MQCVPCSNLSTFLRHHSQPQTPLQRLSNPTSIFQKSPLRPSLILPGQKMRQKMSDPKSGSCCMTNEIDPCGSAVVCTRESCRYAEFSQYKSNQFETDSIVFVMTSNLLHKGYQFMNKLRNQLSGSKATIASIEDAARVVTLKIRSAKGVRYLPWVMIGAHGIEPQKLRGTSIPCHAKIPKIVNPRPCKNSQDHQSKAM